MASEDQKAVEDVSNRLNASNRELVQVRGQLDLKKTVKRKSEFTLNELSILPNNTNTYRTVGRMFLASPLGELRIQIADIIKQSEIDITNFENREKQLERQSKELKVNLKELLPKAQAAGSPSNTS